MTGPKVTQQAFTPAPKKAKTVTITAGSFREALRLLLAAWPDGVR
jgi:hypothetical protein